MTNTICSFECKRRVITSKHINRACDRFDGNVGHQKLHRGKQRKAPPKRGKKLSFFDRNPKLAISLITLISPVPVCYHKLRSIFQHISRIRQPFACDFFPQLKEYQRWIRTSLGFKYRIGTFGNRDILIIPGEFFPQDFILVEIIALIFGQPACNIKVVSVVVNVGNDIKIAYIIARKSLENVL